MKVKLKRFFLCGHDKSDTTAKEMNSREACKKFLMASDTQQQVWPILVQARGILDVIWECSEEI